MDCWSGNLNNFNRNKGYWLNIHEDWPYPAVGGLFFRWGIGNTCTYGDLYYSAEINSDKFLNIPQEFRFTQSTEQAFYLIKVIILDGYEPSQGDILLAYNNGILVGSVEYDGVYTPVPVMGRDFSPQTEGFCEAGDVPAIKLLKANSGEIIDLHGDLPGWSSLGVFMVESLTAAAIETPTEFALYPAFPNPFNPVTTISFSVPTPSPVEERAGVRSVYAGGVVKLQVYDITGRLTETLINEPIEPGFHQIEWNAEGLPSGVYFVKLNAGEISQSQKLMLIK